MARKTFDGVLAPAVKVDRDPQRYQVYAAEEEAMKLTGEQKLNPVTVRMLAQDIQSHPKLVKLYPKAMNERIKLVIKGNTRTSAYYFMGTIFLPKWAHLDWVVCHEIAHLIDRRQNGVVEEGHGPEFCGIMISLVEAMVSPKAAETLRSCYEKHGVKYA